MMVGKGLYLSCKYLCLVTSHFTDVAEIDSTTCQFYINQFHYLFKIFLGVKKS